MVSCLFDVENSPFLLVLVKNKVVNLKQNKNDIIAEVKEVAFQLMQKASFKITKSKCARGN